MSRHKQRAGRIAGMMAVVGLALSVMACRIAPSGALVGPSVGAQPFWRVDSKHFTLQSDAGEAESKEIVKELERKYNLLREVAFGLEKDPDFHTDVIVFRLRDDYKAVAPGASDGYYTSSLIVGGLERPTFVTHGGLAMRTGRTLVHELTHRFVRYVIPQAPLWLNEGMAEYYEMVEVEDGKAVFGRSSYPFKRGDSWTYGAGAIPIDALPAFAELATFDPTRFYAARDSEEGEAGIPARQEQTANYAAAWAAVHYLQHASPERRAQFDDWISSMSSGMSASAAWSKAFPDLRMEDMTARLKEHVTEMANGSSTLLRTPYDDQAGTFDGARPMKDWEINLTLADLHASQGNGAEAVRRVKAVLDQSSKEDAAPEGSVEALVRAGYYLTLTDAKDAAESALKVALKAAPEHEGAVRTYFDLLVSPGYRNEAREKAANALLEQWKDKAKHPLTLNNFAWQLAITGNAEGALQLAQRATTADASCATCFDTLAFAMFGTGAYKSAVEAQELAAALGAENENRYFGQQLKLYRDVWTAIVIWKKRPEPGKDPAELPEAAAKAILAAMAPATRACAPGKPTTKTTGSALFHVHVTPVGTVSARDLPEEEWKDHVPAPGGPRIPDDATRACMATRLGALHFPTSSAASDIYFPVVVRKRR